MFRSLCRDPAVPPWWRCDEALLVTERSSAAAGRAEDLQDPTSPAGLSRQGRQYVCVRVRVRAGLHSMAGRMANCVLSVGCEGRLPSLAVTRQSARSSIIVSAHETTLQLRRTVSAQFAAATATARASGVGSRGSRRPWNNRKGGRQLPRILDFRRITGKVAIHIGFFGPSRFHYLSFIYVLSHYRIARNGSNHVPFDESGRPDSENALIAVLARPIAEILLNTKITMMHLQQRPRGAERKSRHREVLRITQGGYV